MDESEAAAACTRQLMDEVGGPDRQCPCGVCAYRRGEALTPRQVAHLDHYVFDDVHRFVVPIVREEGGQC